MIQGSIELRGRLHNKLRCPYCHSEVLAEERRRACPSCRAPHHRECWGAHGRCSACGASEARARSPRPIPRLGGLGPLRYEHTRNRTIFEWGADADEVRARFRLSLFLILSGGLGAVHWLLPRSLHSAAFSALVLGLVVILGLLFFHPPAPHLSGRLVADCSGLRRDRLNARGAYVPLETLPWFEVLAIGRRAVEEAEGGHEVYAETARGRRTLACFRLEEHARRFLRHLQRSRERLAIEIDPRLIRVQPRRGQPRERA